MKESTFRVLAEGFCDLARVLTQTAWDYGREQWRWLRKQIDWYLE